MAIAPINLLAILGAIVLAISVPSLGYSYPYQVTPMCQKMQQLCGINGPYSCCPGLQCIVSRNAVGGGLCIPKLPPPFDQVVNAVNRKPSNRYQGFGDLCVPYGRYRCGNGLKCVVPPRLPGGAAICAPEGLPSTQLMQLLYALFGMPPKCQETAQICLLYGPETCCKRMGLRCRASDLGVGVGLCSPF